jgi:uncharacterized protein (TIGR03067 family)
MRAGFLIAVVIAAAVVPDVGSNSIAEAQPAPRETQAELRKLQGLWEYLPGGMEHQDGQQVVRQPDTRGTYFFICGTRLIWLDDEGKPSGREDKITIDVSADPKRISLTPVGDKEEKPSHGIYSATDSGLRIHFGLEGRAAPRQFLELNKPIQGIDGEEWIVSRKILRSE